MKGGDSMGQNNVFGYSQLYYSSREVKNDPEFSLLWFLKISFLKLPNCDSNFPIFFPS